MSTLRLHTRVILNRGPLVVKQKTFRPSNGFLLDEPQPRLPDAPDRGYPRPPAMNRQKGK